ncbi:peptidoglycan DD-metalloendopeptidase family protein [Thauera sp. AutoDN2]|jgi:lipoprotein NlpD|uniref:peptidoglycan DD-metalloendopeptidase family protein n=1 Tax=Thauera sp. AutoDN2 TaxID=3416051 RepID=UPI003F4B7D2A
MQIRASYLILSMVTLLGAGCASQVTAPVRDSSGLPSATGPASSPVPVTGYHAVRQGDTLLGIARQYGVTLPDLVAWNGVTDPNQIQVGQMIRVAPPGTATVAIAAPGGAVQTTPVPVPGGESAAVPIVREPLGGRAPLTEPMAPVPVPTAPATPQTAAPSGQWKWPAGGVVIAGFNEASNKGLDIGGQVGDPVYAAAPGKVVYAGSGLRGYGKLIVIKHNQEYNSVYAHNDKLLVKEDDQVEQGQKIAELGSSEADRPKLHFEIRKQGKAVDPSGYLPAR